MHVCTHVVSLYYKVGNKLPKKSLTLSNNKIHDSILSEYLFSIENKILIYCNMISKLRWPEMIPTLKFVTGYRIVLYGIPNFPSYDVRKIKLQYKWATKTYIYFPSYNEGQNMCYPWVQSLKIGIWKHKYPNFRDVPLPIWWSSFSVSSSNKNTTLVLCTWESSLEGIW